MDSAAPMVPSSSQRFSVRAALAIILCLACAAPAAAQTSIFTVEEARAESYLDIGGAVLTRPAYLGSAQQKTNIYPYIGGQYKGRVFVEPARGAGVYAVNTEKLQVSAFATLGSGRNAEETGLFDDLAFTQGFADEAAEQLAKDALDLDTSVLASVSARYRFKYALGEVTAAIPVAGDVQGYRSEVSIATRLPFQPLGITIFPGMRATFTDSDWNNVYYGINAAQSEATGLNTFDAEGGLSVIGANLFLTWNSLSEMMGDDIQIIAVANYNWLQGDLKRSPLTPDDAGVLAVMGIAKRF